jgi:phage terminase large subunit
MTAVRAYMWAMAGREGIILCARQFMNSLDDSSLEEIKAAIRSEPWLEAFFEIGEKYVRTKCGRIAYKFAGLDRSIESVKSKARILLCWVDEAEPVTDVAWLTLIPTLREEDSELWVTWNPKRKGSPTDLRFRKSQDARYKIVQLNWRDNPKFPAKLERDRQRDLAERPDEYDHVWEGAYGNIAGSILGKWVSTADREGRIRDDVVYDPDGADIEVSSDLGFRDTASWWYWQRKPGGFALLKYEGESGLDADDWIPRIQDTLSELGVKRLGRIWLPHDARAKTFQSKHSSVEKFLIGFGNGKVAVVPQSKKADQISAARAVITRCEFNRTTCEAGLDGLLAWEFEYNDETGVFSREPIHNWASHPSDAYAYGCQVMQEYMPQAPAPENKFLEQATLNDLWRAQRPKGKGRI